MTSKADELRARLIRNFDDVELQSETRPPLYASRGARLAAGTVAVKLGASIDVVEPGMRSCPYHLHHAQEEMFVVIEGEGTLRVAGEMLAIRTGDVMFIPAGPDYPHQIINTSDRPLKYLSISTKDQPEICEYPDSGKTYSFARIPSQGSAFGRMNRLDTDLDYWDGEP